MLFVALRPRRVGTAGWLLAAFALGCDRPPAPQAPAASPGPSGPPPVLSPREAWENRRSAWIAGDARAVWTSMCASSRAEKIRTQERAMEEMRRLDDDALARALRPYAVEPARFRRMTGEEFCLHMLAGTASLPQAAKDRLRSQEFAGAEIEGRTAVCTIASPDGTRELLVLVAEDGAWKVDDAETSRRRGTPSRR